MRYCDFSKMSVDNWNELLCEHPEWYLRCAVLECLCPAATKAILMRNESFASMLNLTQLLAADWVEILAERPERYDICDEMFGVENFNDRQLRYLRHRMNVLAIIDDDSAEYFRELEELFERYLNDKNDVKIGSGDWKMWFNVAREVTFEGRRYNLCECPKPDYFHGFGFALAYPQDGKENKAGFIRCVRLKFIPTDAKGCCDEACGLESSDEWYSPDEDDFVENMEC